MLIKFWKIKKSFCLNSEAYEQDVNFKIEHNLTFVEFFVRPPNKRMRFFIHCSTPFYSIKSWFYLTTSLQYPFLLPRHPPLTRVLHREYFGIFSKRLKITKGLFFSKSSLILSHYIKCGPQKIIIYGNIWTQLFVWLQFFELFSTLWFPFLAIFKFLFLKSFFWMILKIFFLAALDIY